MDPEREKDILNQGDADFTSSDALIGIDSTRDLVQVFSRDVLTRFRDVEASAVMGALELALELHQGQERADGSPYIGHLTSVASRIVLDFGIDRSTIVSAGLLHDAVEDHAAKIAARVSPHTCSKREAQRIALDYLNHEFGSEVSTAVELLTNPIDLSRDARKLMKGQGLSLSEARNQLYLQHVKASTESNEIVLVVKLSDFYDNFGSLSKITSPEKACALTAKYEPLRQYFKERLRSLPDDSIFGERRDTILEQLASMS